MKTWYLGIHRPHWLADPRLAEVPVFISRRTFLAKDGVGYRRAFPRAVGPYAVDSGGFTELKDHGRWTITPAEYVAFLRRLWAETGPFDFAAPMDWMCEPAVITGGQFAGLSFLGTGLTEAEHQRRTVDNLVELRRLAPDLPIIPVIQGWTRDSYLRCIGLYAAAGIDLTTEPLVAVGSVCRRQHMDVAAEIIDAIRDASVRNLHGFGFKIEGLRQCWGELVAADSMAWSLDGRYAGVCEHPPWLTGVRPRSEANCLDYAIAWRARHVHQPARPSQRQLGLFDLAGVG